VTSTALWPWLSLAGLGAFHGINPAMGWLFAVGLGLQSGRARSVAWALLPIGLGHLLAVAFAAAAIEVFAASIDLVLLRVVAALCLLGYGAYRLALGYRHKFRAGMLAGFGDLTLWSFFMATAHGAGLMMAPILLAMPGCVGSGTSALAGPIATAALSVTVHSATMIATAGLVAWAIFARVGLNVLRRGWINVEQVWSGMLVLAGLAALFLVGPEVVRSS
jgi:hypothetical protein